MPTMKKQRTQLAKTLRSDLGGLTLPESIKLAKLMLRGDLKKTMQVSPTLGKVEYVQVGTSPCPCCAGEPTMALRGPKGLKKL